MDVRCVCVAQKNWRLILDEKSVRENLTDHFLPPAVKSIPRIKTIKASVPTPEIISAISAASTTQIPKHNTKHLLSDLGYSRKGGYVTSITNYIWQRFFQAGCKSKSYKRPRILKIVADKKSR